MRLAGVVLSEQSAGWGEVYLCGRFMAVDPAFGTEPVVRIYAELESATDLEVLLEQGHKFLLG